MIIYHILLNIINIGPVIDLSDSTRVSMGKYEIVGEVAIYMVIFKGYSYYNVIYICTSMTLINVEHLIRCSTLSDWSMHLIRCDVLRSPNCIVIEIAHACFFGTPEDENKTPQPINYWNNIQNEKR